MENNKLIAIDGNSLMYRAFYAIGEMTTKTGQATNAIYGFISMLYKLFDYSPSHMLVAFDVNKKTFRHQRFEDYKAGRKETPSELISQMSIIKQLLSDMGIAVYQLEGFEADDIIGTISSIADQSGMDTLIVTGDKDSLQLISDKTHVLITKKGISEAVEFDKAELQNEYGLPPEKMTDLKGLMGDASDNLPGIAGVGEKTALKLLQKYGSFEEVLARAPMEEKGALQTKIINGSDNAKLSYELGIINTTAPILITLEDCRFSMNTISGGRELMEKLQLRTLLKRLPEGESKKTSNLTFDSEKKTISTETITLSSLSEIEQKASELSSVEKLAFHIDGDSIFLCSDLKIQYKIDTAEGLFTGGIPMSKAISALSPALASESEKLVFDAKALFHKLSDYGVALNKLSLDLMITDYLQNAVSPAATLADFLIDKKEHFSSDTKLYPDAAAIFAVADIVVLELNNNNLMELYKNIELPLISVLYDMEKTGFTVNKDTLKDLGTQFFSRLKEIETKIFEEAGEQFNILSPKQLGVILFEKLMLPPGAKTQRGFSTSAEVLENLSDLHPIIPLITEYRFLSKVKSTFIDAMVSKMDSESKIHTTFNQNVTATGRISSTEPNLQNIPVRTEEGRKIRKAFVASPGCKLLDADYSQIELRLLAHISGDTNMINAFLSNHDIHTATASEVFGVDMDSVTKEQRSAAKAVNFGIVYGISDFGLAKNIKTTRAEAGEYIRRYLSRYPKIKEYMTDCIEEARKNGYVSTLMGRRRAVFELKSSNYNTRTFGERVAKNMPIQGTAADIIKLAMVKVHKALSENGLKAKLILQVHDELIIDTPIDEIDKVKELLSDCMQNVMKLSVPLVAEVNVGDTWFDAK